LLLRLGTRVFGEHDLAVMAIVNRTPDSFFDRGATFEESAALEAVDRVVAEGADIVDIGGVKAGVGPEVTVGEEVRRTAGFVARVRERHPDLVISVDTWRAEVGREVCAAGADLLNDAWGGVDPALAEVAAEYGVGLVCSHAGGLTPRTDPRNPTYDDVVADVIAATTRLAERAAGLGVPRDRILVDPAHDFGKITPQSLEISRRLPELIATGWPVLVAMSNKDFLGEALDVGRDERFEATLAANVIAAYQGARVFRVHAVAATRRALDTVAVIQGWQAPAIVRRGVT
jgi:dihydropteroate synthase